MRRTTNPDFFLQKYLFKKQYQIIFVDKGLVVRSHESVIRIRLKFKVLV